MWGIKKMRSKEKIVVGLNIVWENVNYKGKKEIDFEETRNTCYCLDEWSDGGWNSILVVLA